jgi:hypothetical protein
LATKLGRFTTHSSKGFGKVQYLALSHFEMFYGAVLLNEVRKDQYKGEKKALALQVTHS